MKTRLRYQNERVADSKYQRRHDNYVGPQHNQNGSIRQKGLAKAFALGGNGPAIGETMQLQSSHSFTLEFTPHERI